MVNVFVPSEPHWKDDYAAHGFRQLDEIISMWMDDAIKKGQLNQEQRKTFIQDFMHGPVERLRSYFEYVLTERDDDVFDWYKG
jgi:succinate dehydrogenase flavin-adding protein (antitoxin of CptAB toxin-antitoxin module)